MKSKRNPSFFGGEAFALDQGMESGVHKKHTALYWITWITLFAAPVVSAWGSQSAGSAAPPKTAQPAVCESQECIYSSARDQLVFKFIYHSEHAKLIQDTKPDEMPDELRSFCAGVVPGPGESHTDACKKTYLQATRVNLELLRVEIHRMNDAIARLRSGSANLLMPVKLDAQGNPIQVQPRIPAPLELADFQKVIAKSVDPQAQTLFNEWAKFQPREPLPQHFPKILPYKVTEADGTVRDMVKIDRSCPENPGSECYNMQEYQAARQLFLSKNPRDLRPALTHPSMAKAADQMYKAPLHSRAKAYESSRIQVNAAVERVVYGFDPKESSPVRALASQPKVRKKSASNSDVNVFMVDQDMRNAIDSIQF